jgi:hypothetical protein
MCNLRLQRITLKLKERGNKLNKMLATWISKIKEVPAFVEDDKKQMSKS